MKASELAEALLRYPEMQVCISAYYNEETIIFDVETVADDLLEHNKMLLIETGKLMSL